MAKNGPDTRAGGSFEVEVSEMVEKSWKAASNGDNRKALEELVEQTVRAGEVLSVNAMHGGDEALKDRETGSDRDDVVKEEREASRGTWLEV